MNVTVNGKPQAVAGKSAADLLDELNIARERVAVVINEQVVRRANLASTVLQEGDVVEVITMVGGG